jgi:hypothetical protein
LSADGSNPASQWQSKEAGSALEETSVALGRHVHWLEPATVALLRRGHGRQAPESPTEGL